MCTQNDSQELDNFFSYDYMGVYAKLFETLPDLDTNLIWEADGFKILKKLYYSKASLGHENNQHWYPKFLIRNFNKDLNREVYLDNTGLHRRPLKISKPYDFLYSAKNQWSAQVEGIFTGVEGLLANRFAQYNVGKNPHLLGVHLNVSEASRLTFALLAVINILRTPSIIKNLGSEVPNNNVTSYDAVFLDPGNVDYIIQTAIFLAGGTWEVHTSPNLELLLGEEAVKLVHQQQGITKYKHFTNSAIYLPLTFDSILTITPPNSDGSKWKSIRNYHGNWMPGLDPNDCVLHTYNSHTLGYCKYHFTHSQSKNFITELP